MACKLKSWLLHLAQSSFPAAHPSKLAGGPGAVETTTCGDRRILGNPYVYQFELDLADGAGRFHLSDTDPVSELGILSKMAISQ